MAWVRYDDQFHVNPKVTAVIAEDAAALALHVLANTWTNSQKILGFIPKHQPGVLVCDRSQGAAWAQVLTRHGLWHERANDCAACQEEYADLPADVDGFVIHNAKEYRAPARERLTSGTAAELSEKRREAGRRGGMASAAKRNQTNKSKSKQTEAKRPASQADEAKNEPGASTRAAVAASDTNPQVQVEASITPPAETQQTVQASQANGVSKASKLLLAGVSPVPGTSPYGEVPPEPETLFASGEAKPAAPSDETPNQRANRLTKVYTERIQPSNFPAISKIVRKAVDANCSDDLIAKGLNELADEGRSVTVDALRIAMYGKPRSAPTQSRNAQIIDAAMERAIRAERVEATIPRGEIPA